MTVGEKTHLKGAVISSTADKEKSSLTTGNLVMEDIQNKAEFSDKTVGIGYAWNRQYEELKGKSHLTPEEKSFLDNHYNKMGLVPELSPGLKGSASSVIKSAIADGKVVITKIINISQINRNTANTLNTLDKIFDKKKVEEKQEIARLFSKNVNEAIHIISANKGWKDGSSQKVALHTFFGGIEGESSNKFSDKIFTYKSKINPTYDLLTNNCTEFVYDTSPYLNELGFSRDPEPPGLFDSISNYVLNRR